MTRYEAYKVAQLKREAKREKARRKARKQPSIIYGFNTVK